ncbi:hypothetical protein H5410_008869 [Solanum commersonii]|uniref:C3H1-type domain-containing protein n=1 Tax=Solanum commersonii TaxID=4109 RepID=A0A9J6AH24_SOLCO|nr:hypothetical protein H5410_008869 [Solanum commersonii]
MQNENPSSDGLNTSIADAATVPSANKNYTFSDATSPDLADNPFLSPTSTHQFDSSEFIPNFYSTFSRSSNSPSLTSFDDTDDLVTDGRLHQASYILEYQQLYNRYTLCLAHLQESIKEVEALHQENESLRLVNTDLDRRLSLLTQATIQNCLLSDFNRFGMGVNRDTQISDPRPPNIRQGSVVEPNRPERRNAERVSLPKSISVRSSGYLKLKAQGGNSGGGPSQAKARPKSTAPPLTESQQRVYVPGSKKEEEALEFDVYNQGMLKTELCNKWQETGTCPYGENCQFAHGITELRPVIRHPRYKTEVCRMVLAGDMCPYGHRCHFRHSLTEEERRAGPGLF